jgi:hypothetical protein
MNAPSGVDAATISRNARAEADDALASVGVAGSCRVLEPSPPAVTSEPYFADDPAGVDSDSEETDNTILPAGVTGSSKSWDDVVADHPQLGSWATDSWLSAERRFAPVPGPATLATTRTALHRLAAYVIAPVRHQAIGKFGLRWTKDGFGTPFFPHTDGDRQIRVQTEGNQVLLVDQIGDTVRATPVTSLAEAATFLDTEIDGETAAEHDSPPVGDPHAELDIVPGAAQFLGSWFAMAFAGLESFRSRPDTVDPGRPQLWPGHFDPAIEAGTEAGRASYGASPGDETSAEPYLYVSVWWPDRIILIDDVDHPAPGLAANGFTGRLLPLSQFPADTDPAEVAARFWSDTAALIRHVD